MVFAVAQNISVEIHSASLLGLNDSHSPSESPSLSSLYLICKLEHARWVDNHDQYVHALDTVDTICSSLGRI